MAQKEYGMLFKLSAQLGREFGTTFSSAQKTFTETQKEIRALSQQQADISAYQKQQNAVDAVTKKLENLKQEYDNIQREISETEGYSASLSTAELRKKVAIEDTEKALERQTEKLTDMGKALANAGIDTGNLAEESKKLEGQLDALAERQANAESGAEDFGAGSVKAFTAIGDAMVAAGIAAGLKKIFDGYKECISIAADFEETMSSVEALSGSSAEEMNQLSEMAKELGATTKFTAKESADAMTYMGMAGWNAEQMLSGMDGVLQLAAASGEDLATVSDIVTDNLTAFGMAASETARFSDVLAATATKSNTNVSIMGETFKKSAPVAGALGYSIEDVAVSVGLMANAGVKGSRAGTALSNTFTGLLNGVTLTANAFGELDYSAIAADGTMKSYGDTIVELRGYFDQMTEAEKTMNAMNIAGKQGYAGLLAILNASDADFQKLTDSINNCSGAAKKMSEIKLDNLNGQMTLLNSAADAVKTTIGEAFLPELKALASAGTEVLSWIGGAAEKWPVLVKSIIALTAALGGTLLVYKAIGMARNLHNTYTALSAVLTAKAAAASGADAVAKTAEAAATNSATTAQTGLNAAMAASPLGWILGAVGVVTVSIVALSECIRKEADETKELTAASREQQEQLQAANAEYERACELYGENSEEARTLQGEVTLLREEFEASKMTMEEFNQQVEETIAAYNEFVANHDAAIRSIDEEGNVSLALAARLENLAEKTNKTKAEQEAMLSIVDALNERIPNLGLAYNSVMGSINMTTESVRALIEAEIAQEKLEQNRNDLVETVKQQQALEEQLTKAKKEVAAAQREYDETSRKVSLEYSDDNQRKNQEAYNNLKNQQKALTDLQKEYDDSVKKEQELYKEMGIYSEAAQTAANATDDASEATSRMGYDSKKTAEDQRKFNAALRAVTGGFLEAEDAAANYGVDLDTLKNCAEESEEWQKALESAVTAVSSGFYTAEDAAEAYGLTVNSIEKASAIQSAIDDLSALGEKYNEVKDAAEQSINGQYSLWDQAAVVMATDIDKINNSLETQTSYWSDYNTDLSDLLARADEIDGLSDVIASFADGSTDSVNAIAGMAEASDDDLRKMVENWKEVQRQQGEAVDSLTELSTGFSEEFEKAKGELEAAVDGLNLDDEAAKSAKDTIDAYAQAIRDGTEDAVQAADELSSLVAAALQANPYSVSTRDDYEVPGYASGTDSASPGVRLVGENGPELMLFHGGEQVLTAEETRAYMRQWNDSKNALSAYTKSDAEAAAGVEALYTGDSRKISISISPSFVVESNDEDIEDRLRTYSDELKAEIIDALDEAGIDAKRGAYV